MATATRVKAIPVIEPPDTVHLELSLLEARVLLSLVAVIGGTNSSRKQLSSIGAALSGVGVFGNIEDYANLYVSGVSW